MFDPKAPFFDEKGYEYASFVARLAGEPRLNNARNYRIWKVWSRADLTDDQKRPLVAEIDRHFAELDRFYAANRSAAARSSA